MNIHFRILRNCKLSKYASPFAVTIRTSVNLSFKILGTFDPESEAPPVIICHGLLETRRSWRGVAKTIRNLTKRSVVIVDLRNHGASPHASSQRYESQARDVFQLMKKLEIKRASLMGHNVGARTVMCAALMAPALVAGLLVVDMSPVSTSPEFKEYYPKLMEEMSKVVWKEKRKVHKAQKAIKKQLKHIIKDEVTMKAVLNNINVTPEGSIGWTCNLDVLKKQFKHLSSFPKTLKGKQYDGPTMFIGGQISEYLPYGEIAVKYGMKALHRQRCNVILSRVPTIKVHHRSAVDLAHKIHGGNESGGAPVVVLHGLLGSKRNWDSMCKLIASLNRKVVAADIRNHGESPHDSSHTYPELASDVSKLIDTLALKQPVVIGHSMGGRTAMTLALTEPDKVSKLIAVDISPVSTAGILNDFFPKLIDQMKAVDFSGQQKNSVTQARGFARQQLLSSGMFADGGGIQFILMNIGKRGDTIGWMCNLDALKQHFTDIATFPEALKSKQYNGPVLFIGGDQSNYIPPTDIDGIRGIFPKAELQYVKGVGHNVHAEDPKSFFHLVSQFLSK